DEFLAFVEDPRVERTRKHPLETILVISLMAVICGADGFVGSNASPLPRRAGWPSSST
ncbi:MAG: Tnp 1-associated, partial [Pseudomonadota bacterium]